MRPIISSKKHYNQVTLTNVAAGAASTTIIALAIEGEASTPDHVKEGAVVKAVWVEMWAQSDSASVTGSATAIIYKNPGGNANATAANVAALHDYDNKKNIFYATQGLMPTTDGGLFVIFKGWVKIPKGKQRMGLGDKINLTVRNNNGTDDINICGMFTFKSYT